GEIERRIAVGARSLDHLEAVIRGALGGIGVGVLDHAGCLFGSRLHLGIGVLGLDDALLRHFAERRGGLGGGFLELRNIHERKLRLEAGDGGGFLHDTTSIWRTVTGAGGSAMGDSSARTTLAQEAAEPFPQ